MPHELRYVCLHSSRNRAYSCAVQDRGVVGGSNQCAAYIHAQTTPPGPEEHAEVGNFAEKPQGVVLLRGHQNHPCDRSSATFPELTVAIRDRCWIEGEAHQLLGTKVMGWKGDHKMTVGGDITDHNQWDWRQTEMLGRRHSVVWRPFLPREGSSWRPVFLRSIKDNSSFPTSGPPVEPLLAT